MPAKKQEYYTIYKCTSPSGKVYIGITQFRLSDRISQHHSDARRGVKRPFYAAIRKYKDQMKWEIINIYFNKGFAFNREQFFIKKYKSNCVKFGYNCTSGGEGASMIHPNRRVKIIDNLGNIYDCVGDASESLKIPVSNIRSSLRLKSYCGDYYFSKYRNGMKCANKPLTISKKERKTRLVCEKNQICFLSSKDAADYIEVAHQSIHRVIQHKRESVRGFYLKKINDDFKKEEKKPKVIDDLGNIFISISEAARSINASSGQVCVGIKKKSVVKGRSFCLYSPDIKKCPTYLRKTRRPVLCLNNNKIYPSASFAAKDLNLKTASVIDAVTKKRNSIKGYVFNYYTGGDLSQS